MKSVFSLVLIPVFSFMLAGCVKTPLTAATMSGSTKEINALIDKGADVNEGGPCVWDGYLGGGMAGPPLICAAWGGRVEAAKALLDRGADINARDKWGRSALWNAARNGHAGVVRLLIERGADVDLAMAQLQSDGWKEGFYLVERLAKQQPSRKSETLVSAPAQQAYPAIKSDVDELPAMKVKRNNKSYAIVVGIENYRQKLPKADFATQDAKLVADYLTKALGYPEENVITLLNEQATNVDFVKYFEKWLLNNVEKDSTVFIYYSGHGAPDPKSGSAFLVPFDGDPAFIDETGYSLKRMYAALGKLPANEVIVVLDSCFSGAGGRSVLAKGARPLVMNLKHDIVLSKNMTVMSASSGDQISSTFDEKGHGLFTYFMLKGIKNEDVTRPDGSIKLDDLFSYIKPQVERIARKQYNNEQTPQLIEPKKN